MLPPPSMFAIAGSCAAHVQVSKTAMSRHEHVVLEDSN